MNLELILWIVGWFVISEIVFVVWYSRICKRDEDEWGHPLAFSKGDWGIVKMISLMIVGVLVGGHYMSLILPPIEGDPIGYVGLLYELIFLGVLALIILTNKIIARRIEK